MKIKSEIRKSGGLEYIYELIRDGGGASASSYSVAVRLKGKNGRTITASVCELFTDEAVSLTIFKKLVDNLATPINLPYVIEDEKEQ